MAHIAADRVKETTATISTGPLTLIGATAGFRAFSAVMAAADTCYYAISSSSGAEWEVGIGTFNTTLARTTVLASSNANALVNFSAGTKDVFITGPASRLLTLDNEQAANFPAIATEPGVPATNTLDVYAKNVSGRMVLKVKGPSGLDTVLQNALWGNSAVIWTPTAATAGLWQGTVGAGAGTFSNGLPTTTSIYTSIKRSNWANVVTTLNQVLGQRGTEALFFRGAVASQGGFFFFARFGFGAWTNGARLFAGMHTGTTVISADPSLLNNTAGFCIDAADNGAISFLTRDTTTATKAATGFTAVTGKGYDVFIFCQPNGTDISWRIKDINAGTEASGTATATLPVNTTMLTPGVLASNAALTPVTSVQLGLNRIYVETDY